MLPVRLLAPVVHLFKITVPLVSVCTIIYHSFSWFEIKNMNHVFLKKQNAEVHLDKWKYLSQNYSSPLTKLKIIELGHEGYIP